MAYGGSVNTDILSDETFDLLCRICKREGKNQEAEKYCLECKDYYCLKCVKVHEHVPALTGHKILDKSQFPSGSIKSQSSIKPGSSKSQPMAPTERCDRHNHHCIDMYCQNHDDVGCGTCMAVDHRSCQDIVYIPEFLKNNTTPLAPRDIQQKLESASKTLKVHHDNLQREKQRLLKKKTDSLEDISKFRKKINDQLDELDKSTVDVIEGKYKILINMIDEGMKHLDTSKVKVTSAQKKLASAGSNTSQNFVNVKKGKSIASSAAKCLEENKALTHPDDIEFIPDQRIPALLQEVKAFGKIVQRSSRATEVTGDTQHPAESSPVTGVTSKTQQSAESSPVTEVTSKTQQPAGRKQKYSPAGNDQQKEALLQVNGSKKYSVQVQSDSRRCNIFSACSLEDGTIILSDFNNNKLKRLDSSTYTVTDHCDLPGEPWQVCPINLTNQVAVCLRDKEEVNFIEVGNSMTITSKITTDFQCYGLAYAGGNLYISDGKTSVYIYSIQGRQLKQLRRVQSGQEMFSCIRSLAVNEDGSRIYVTDYKNGLIVLDSNGQVVGKFNGSQLAGAYDSYLTGRGSLLVCGHKSKNVLQFGLNGELIGEVVKSIIYPGAICCNQQMSKMITGIGRNNEIEVYDLV